MYRWSLTSFEHCAADSVGADSVPRQPARASTAAGRPLSPRTCCTPCSGGARTASRSRRARRTPKPSPKRTPASPTFRTPTASSAPPCQHPTLGRPDHGRRSRPPPTAPGPGSPEHGDRVASKIKCLALVAYQSKDRGPPPVPGRQAGRPPAAGGPILGSLRGSSPSGSVRAAPLTSSSSSSRARRWPEQRPQDLDQRSRRGLRRWDQSRSGWR